MELLPRIRRQPMVLTQGVDLGKQENVDWLFPAACEGLLVDDQVPP